MVENCPLCTTNPTITRAPRGPRIKPVQARGTYPGEERQGDFTAVPRAPGNSRHLLVLVDTFSGWPEAFPAGTQTAATAAKALLKEKNPQDGLPGALQGNKGPACVSGDRRDNKCPGHKRDLALSLETP